MESCAPSLQNRLSAWRDYGVTLTDSEDANSPSRGQDEGDERDEEEEEAEDTTDTRYQDKPTVDKSRVAALRQSGKTRERSDSADLFLDCVHLLSSKSEGRASPVVTASEREEINCENSRHRSNQARATLARKLLSRSTVASPLH